MSFKVKDKITVYSKSATETSDDIWLVEINGRFGYAPKKFITEEKIIVSTAKLITVQNVADTATALPSAAKPDKVQNINESLPNVQSVEINANDSNEAAAASTSKVQSEETPDGLDSSTDAPNVVSKSEELNDTVDTPKTEEVKVEDLNEYDSKNFEENVDSNDVDDEEEEEEDEEDEYDDAENALESEEESQETRKPVVEEPFVKKTAYVTTDKIVEKSGDITNGDIQPTLEIMAPTQAEIEQLKQQKELNDSAQGTNAPSSSLDSTAENTTPLTSSTTKSESTVSTANENQFTTTIAPVDIPQNPLDIPVETTTPIPDATPSIGQVPTQDNEQEKVEPLPTNSESDNSVTADVPILKADPVTAETTPIPETEQAIVSDEIPPFKPLPSSVNDVVSDSNDSTTEVPNVVIDQKVEINLQINSDPADNKESVKPPVVNSNDVNDRDAVTNTILSEEQQIVKEDQPVTTAPVEVVDSFEISEENVPKQETQTIVESTVKTPPQDVEHKTAAELDSEPNDTITKLDDVVIEEREIVTPLDVPTAELLTENLKEGVAFVEPILQSVQTEQQQPAVSDDTGSEQDENVESKEGLFGSLFSSVKNLFGGSSTVESIVEDASNENFDKALNDILFASPSSKDNDKEGK